MYLSKPLNGNGSSISVNDMQPPHTPLTPHTPLPGIRAHLGHLLPRHTLFRARITIHQISSVPFVSGEFGVRWKLKGVQSPTVQKSGLLVRVKARADKRTLSDKGKGREDAGQMGTDSPQALPSLLPATEEGHVGGRQNVGGGRSASGPINRSGTTSSHASSVSSHSSLVGHSQHLSADWGTNSSSASKTNSSSTSKNSSAITVAPTPSTTNSDLSTILNSPIVSSTPARGMTPFLKLKDHSVVWSQTLDTVIKFDVDRESSLIQPNPLKLVVMQRVIPDDPHGSPQNPRLGAVYLNLAEYVGQGVVERRYLLKESKTNATLKLSIEMTYVSGETTYVPPPLAKGEILTGIAGFLENDAMKKRPRALDIYGPYQDQDELEIDLLGAKSTAIPRTAKSMRRPSDKSSPPDSDSDDDDDDQSMEEVGIAFDVQRLPFAYGTKTTELLIDALFNPVKISEKRDESPFTVYEPPSPGSRDRSRSRQRSEIGLGLSGIVMDHNATISAKRQGSSPHPRRQESTSSSVYTTTSSGSTGSKAETSESSKSRPKDGIRSQSESGHGQGHNGSTAAAAQARSTPEGRVVVGPAQEEQIGGVRAWWRKRTRPSTPTQKT